MPATRKRTATRDQPRDLVPPDPTVCRCRPVTVGTFRHEQLVEVERRHLRASGCHHPAEAVDVATYQVGIGGRR